MITTRLTPQGTGTLAIPIRGDAAVAWTKTGADTGTLQLTLPTGRYECAVALVWWCDPEDATEGVQAWHSIIAVEGYHYRVSLTRGGVLTLHDDTTQPSGAAWGRVDEDGRVLA